LHGKIAVVRPESVAFVLRPLQDRIAIGGLNDSCSHHRVRYAIKPCSRSTASRVQVLFDPALIAVLDAHRREAEGLSSRSEVIRQAVRALASISTERHSADVKQHQSESAESPGLQNRYVVW
jgi:Arc/MetJ-type ribon-helix-helix transcriptional regulator